MSQPAYKTFIFVNIYDPQTPLILMQRALTCGLAVLGVTQVAKGTFVITQVIEGDAGSVHGLEVVSLVAQHFQTVLLHSLVVHQFRLQQTRCGGEDREQLSG